MKADPQTNVVVMQPSVDHELVSVLRELIEQAQAGSIVGFAYISLRPGGQYSGDVIGAARRLPLLALGVVKALENQVINLPK